MARRGPWGGGKPPPATPEGDGPARPAGGAAPARGLTRTDFHGAIAANRRNTTFLCLGLILIGGLLGYVMGWAIENLASGGFQDAGYSASLPAGKPGTGGGGLGVLWFSPWGIWSAVFMLVFGSLWTLIALTWGDRMVIAMAGAREVTKEQQAVLHNVVEEMSIAAGLPKPRVFLMDTPALNAFATGMKPERAAIGVTRGLLDTLDRDELQGVVGHEMGHIANGDILYATAVGVMVGMIALVADLGLRSSRVMMRGAGRGSRRGGGAVAIIVIIVLLVFLILAPVAARLVQMAISRQREYLADATSVGLTRNPVGLIRALERIAGSTAPMERTNRAIQHLFIANPLRNFDEKAKALFSTHPATSLRIARLRDLGA